MTYNPDTHHRRSIRLTGYNYAAVGAYFVTICTQHRECFFGEIANREMILNDSGRMVFKCWQWLEEQFNFVQLDQFVIMPNHFHGIIHLNCTGESCIRPIPEAHPPCTGESCIRPIPEAHPPCTGESCIRPDHSNTLFKSVYNKQGASHKQGEHKVRPYKPNGDNLPNGTADGTIGRIVQAFKSKSTHQYITGVKQHNWPAFDKRLWQRNYYERILRNDDELDIRRQYIETNPFNWNDDKYNPVNKNSNY
ncbi:MAG: transposase [Deltaproteobacteria bacterium]|nr:transposase [Deltaproteobacteria bacterium]